MNEIDQTEEAAGRPIPATIPLPDHPIRHNGFFQFYVRAARPLMNWVAVAGAGNALFNQSMDDMMRGSIFVFALIVLGIRTTEKIKGVA